LTIQKRGPSKSSVGSASAKIFNVHFRNIKGHRGDFVAECFPDDGDIDLPATVEVYREVGYDGMLMPDHIPRMMPMGRTEAQTRTAEDESFSFACGYIRGLVQSAGCGRV
jgi:mannonate dehydratase